MKKTTLVLVCLIMLVLGTLIWKNSNSNTKKQQPVKEVSDKLRVGYIGSLFPRKLLMDIGQDKGFFAKNKLEVTDVVVEKGSDSLLQSNGADVAIIGFSGALGLYLNDVDVRVISRIAGTTSTGLGRLPKGQEQLIKKVALPRFGGEPQMLITLALRKFNVDAEKVEFLAIPDEATRIEKLKNGEIDFTYSNALSNEYVQNEKLGNSVTIYKANEVFDSPTLAGCIATLQEKIDSNPVAIQKFILSSHEIIQYITNNQAEVITFIQNKYNENPEQAASEYASVSEYFKETPFLPTWNNDDLKSAVEDIAKYYKPSNPTKNIDSFFNDSFEKKAIIELQK